MITRRNKFYKLHVKSISEWVSFLLNLQSRNTGQCSCGTNYAESDKWIFRGQECAEWQLRSAFERHLATRKNLGLPEHVLRLIENSAVDSFKRDLRLKFTGIKEQNNVDWLALMQHYGAPTRLLDFTESAFVSLFFAVENNPTTDYAVWAVRLNELSPVVRPSLLRKIRKISENQQNKLDFPLPQRSNDYLQDSLARALHIRLTYSCVDEGIRNNYNHANTILGRNSRGLPRREKKPFILPIRPAHNNERIAAQSGLFLMPSMLSRSFVENLKYSLKDPEEIEDCLQISDSEKISTIIHSALLIKFIFPVATLQEAKVLLECSNISAKTLFPGVEGVAKSIDYFKSMGKSWLYHAIQCSTANLKDDNAGERKH